MTEITLLPIDPSMAEALSLGPDVFRQHYGAALGDSAEAVRDVVAQTLSMPAATPPWGGYLAVQEESDLVIGTCAFTGSPAENGVVEIAYFTFPEFERRGVASAMAGKLLEVAWERPEVSAVIAHTLPEENASTRILQRLGFRLSGEAMDPDAGRVWRWSISRPAP